MAVGVAALALGFLGAPPRQSTADVGSARTGAILAAKMTARRHRALAGRMGALVEMLLVESRLGHENLLLINFRRRGPMVRIAIFGFEPLRRTMS